MRVVVVGAGSIGSRHLANLRALGHEVVVIDTDPTRGQHQRLSVQCGRLDAAIIATPAKTHLALLRECIAWGLPVLVEKPLGVVADLPALRALRPTRPVMIGYQLRFHPALRAAKVLVPNPVCGYFTCACDSRSWPGSAWRGDLLLEMSHEIDAALWCGAPHTVSADETFADDDEAEITLGPYADRWRVRVDWRSAVYCRDWQIISEQSEAKYIVKDSDEFGPVYVDELAHFLRAVEGGPIAPGCTLEEGIATLDVVRQVEELTRTR